MSFSYMPNDPTESIRCTRCGADNCPETGYIRICDSCNEYICISCGHHFFTLDCKK